MSGANTKIAIIGAGQLGSRHLQGLVKSNLEISIEVVEPFAESQRIAKLRLQEIPINNKIKKVDFFESIQELSSELFLVIVATNADVRYRVVKELLETKKVKYLVLEKVLFQKIDEYFAIEELIQKKQTKTWVNHPRRMFPFYKNLKKSLSNNKHIHFSVSGGAWGLGCNGLHFLDCMEYLINGNDIDINTHFLDKNLYDTKRSGFHEINGLLIGTINKSSFSINCFPEEISPIQFNISSDKLNILIDETNGWYRISEKNNNWSSIVKEEKIIYFQSELTNVLLEDIYNNNCFLPTYKEAMTLHIEYLQALMVHINNFSDSKYENCPIT